MLDQIKILEQNIEQLQSHVKKVIADTLSEFAKLKKSNLDELLN